MFPLVEEMVDEAGKHQVGATQVELRQMLKVQPRWMLFILVDMLPRTWHTFYNEENLVIRMNSS
jgi:hypothetical protein